jgi:hypothetical protein
MKNVIVAVVLFVSGLALGSYFRGGTPTAVAGGASPLAKGGLPASGQTKCYDASGKEVPCDGTACPGQDGLYKAGCPGDGRFVDNKDGTVTDSCTGLMWQKETADVNGDGSVTEQDSLPWCKALEYCENLNLARHDDWRLPNVRELESIVDYGRFKPSIDPALGAVSSVPSVYWSSTSLVARAIPWYVDFVGGSVGLGEGKDTEYYLRAVRNAP